MRVLVCGSRTWTDYRQVATKLKTFADANGGRGALDMTVIHGGARGADRLVERAIQYLCEEFDGDVYSNIEVRVFPADWNKYGKAAGFIRNKQMLEEGKPDIVLAFWDGKSRGTANMIQLAKAAGVEVKIFLPGQRSREGLWHST